MKYLIVVDMQNDFCTGSLANEEAVKTIPFIKKKIKEFLGSGNKVIFTQDTHRKNYLNTLEGAFLPVEHCIENTDGWKVVSELIPDNLKNVSFVSKQHFGFTHWEFSSSDEVWICGTCTDICVISNALIIKAKNDINVHILKDGCSGLTKEKHEHALDVLSSCQCIIE